MKYLMSIFIAFSFIGCEQQPKVRHYTELTVTVDPKVMGAGTMVPMGNHRSGDTIAWDVPSGWVESSGGPMQLVTLTLAHDPSAFDCSIVALPGGAGGLEANLKRWMGQINLRPSELAFAEFIKNSKNNVYDFSELQHSADPQAPSMITATKEISGQTIFVKLKGTKASVIKYRLVFLTLFQSVRSQ